VSDRGSTARYAVEIHDLSPATGGRLDALLALLPPRARDVAALLVVPNWGGHLPITAHPAFVADLAGRPGEKVLHGLTHSRGPSRWNALWYGTEDESEFGRLTRADAASRLDEAIALFATAFGERPRWFCAPRWRESAGAANAVAAAFPARLRRRDLRIGETRRVAAESLWFDDGARRAARTIGAWLRAPRRRALLGGRQPFRLVLHPRDLEQAAVRREIETVGAMLEAQGWTPVSLGALAA
jgi:uncharacterized protein